MTFSLMIELKVKRTYEKETLQIKINKKDNRINRK